MPAVAAIAQLAIAQIPFVFVAAEEPVVVTQLPGSGNEELWRRRLKKAAEQKKKAKALVEARKPEPPKRKPQVIPPSDLPPLHQDAPLIAPEVSPALAALQGDKQDVRDAIDILMAIARIQGEHAREAAEDAQDLADIRALPEFEALFSPPKPTGVEVRRDPQTRKIAGATITKELKLQRGKDGLIKSFEIA